jgi:large subunit ribosomal protein L10e
MAKLRKGVAYRNLERPYTRKSKFRNKQFVRGTPHVKIVRFEHGDKKKNYGAHIKLVAKDSLQVRQEALESLRQTTNRFLEKNIGKNQYFFRLRMYPFHVLRENPLASGAGADRMSTGMKKSFGKPIGVAAQIKEGKLCAEVYAFKAHETKAKLGLSRGMKKLPGTWAVQIDEYQGQVQ